MKTFYVVVECIPILYLAWIIIRSRFSPIARTLRYRDKLERMYPGINDEINLIMFAHMASGPVPKTDKEILRLLETCVAEAKSNRLKKRQAEILADGFMTLAKSLMK